MNSKFKNEEDIYCNLVTLFVLLCLKVTRCLQTQEKSEENLKQAVIINKTTQVIF